MRTDAWDLHQLTQVCRDQVGERSKRPCQCSSSSRADVWQRLENSEHFGRDGDRGGGGHRLASPTTSALSSPYFLLEDMDQASGCLMGRPRLEDRNSVASHERENGASERDPLIRREEFVRIALHDDERPWRSSDQLVCLTEQATRTEGLNEVVGGLSLYEDSVPDRIVPRHETLNDDCGSMCAKEIRDTRPDLLGIHAKPKAEVRLLVGEPACPVIRNRDARARTACSVFVHTAPG
jgi:hypothetical protein